MNPRALTLIAAQHFADTRGNSHTFFLWCDMHTQEVLAHADLNRPLHLVGHSIFGWPMQYCVPTMPGHINWIQREDAPCPDDPSASS